MLQWKFLALDGCVKSTVHERYQCCSHLQLFVCESLHSVLNLITEKLIC